MVPSIFIFSKQEITFMEKQILAMNRKIGLIYHITLIGKTAERTGKPMIRGQNGGADDGVRRRRNEGYMYPGL
jgi:hypothetical protein